MCGSGSMSGFVGGCLKLSISGEDRAVRLLANRWQIIKMNGKTKTGCHIYIYIHKFLCDPDACYTQENQGYSRI